MPVTDHVPLPPVLRLYVPPPEAVLPGPAWNVPLPDIVIVLPSGAIAVSDGVVAPTTQMYVAWLPFALLAAASPLTPSSSPSASNANTNGRLMLTSCSTAVRWRRFPWRQVCFHVSPPC